MAWVKLVKYYLYPAKQFIVCQIKQVCVILVNCKLASTIERNLTSLIGRSISPCKFNKQVVRYPSLTECGMSSVDRPIPEQHCSKIISLIVIVR